MEEQHNVFIEVNDLTNSTNDNDTLLLSTKNKTLENLDKLMTSSDCLRQICELLDDELPNEGNRDNETIFYLKIKRKIG